MSPAYLQSPNIPLDDHRRACQKGLLENRGDAAAGSVASLVSIRVALEGPAGRLDGLAIERRALGTLELRRFGAHPSQNGRA